MARKRALRDADAIGDRLGRDRIRASLARQRQHRGNDFALPLVRLQADPGHRSRRGRGIHGIQMVARK